MQKKNRTGSICINSSCVSSDELKEIKLEVDATGLFSSFYIDKNAKNISGHYSSLKKSVAIKKKRSKLLLLMLC